MRLLVVAAIVLGIWYLPRRWQSSSGPAAVEKLAGVLRTVWKVVLAVAAVAVVAAMAQGCDGADPTPGDPSGGSNGSEGSGEACALYRAADCQPDGSGAATTTTTAGGILLGDDPDEPDYAPCPAYHEEDCPLATGP